MAVDAAYEELNCCLTHKSSAVRLNAVKALHRIARKEYARALAAARARQEDSDAEVRRAVVEVLCTLAGAAPKGDGTALGLLVARLADWEAEVRQLAVDALAQAAGQADEATLEATLQAVRAHLGSWRADVRRTAVRALSVLARKNDDLCLTALCTCVGDADAEVRSTALRALPALARDGHLCVAEGLEGHLSSARTDTRQRATQGLGRVVGLTVSAYPEIRRLLLRHVSDPEVEVRRAAVEALAQVSKPGDLRALNALGSRLAVPFVPVPPEPKAEDESSDSEAEEEAEEPEEPVPGEPEDDESWVVRRAALQGVALLAPPGDGRLVDVVAERLQDESGEVRRAAAEALRGLAPAESPSAMRCAAEGLEHPLADVRLLAVGELVHFAPRDDAPLVAALLERTRRGEAAEVRRAALAALPRAVSAFHPAAACALLDCAAEHGAETRLAALRALQEMLRKEDVPADTDDSEDEGPPVGIQFSLTGTLHFTAEAEDRKLGLTFETWPPERAVIAKVALFSWSERGGICPGDEVIKVNGADITQMTAEDFEEALEARPLKLTALRPLDREAPPPAPKPAKVRAAALAALSACLRDRDARVRAAASEALATSGGEPAVRPRAMRTKHCLPLDS